jgi:hypothetical protein
MTAELFNVDPAKNDKPPPNGSPQNGLPLKRVSATLRVVMAGVADCWSGVKSLKGMANQDPANVNITGGLIDTGVTIRASISGVADDANKLFGRSAQQLYDLLYPIGEGRLFFNAAQPPIWPNVTAAWQLVSADRYLRTADPIDAGSTGGNASVTTSSVSAGDTGSTALTMAQLPAALLVNAYAANLAGLFKAGTDQRIAQDANTGGGQGHVHTTPAHAHSVQLTPLYVDVAMYRRIS